MKRAQLFVVILSGLYVAHGDNTRHYQFVRRQKTWLDARKFCRQNYVNLASVHSQEQDDDLRRLLSKARTENAWIGLLDDASVWKWSLDGTVFHNEKSYNFWKPGYPTRATDVSSCVTVSLNGYWRDANCDSVFPSVCYNETRHPKYVLVNATKTFYRAKLHCRSLYSRLASIRNQTEQDIVNGLVTRRTWIGLNRKRFQQWTNSQYVKYRNWNETQPEIPETIKRRCGLVSASTGKWFEVDCLKKHHFVCEKLSQVHQLKMKMKFQSSANMNDPAVIRQIKEQIHAKLTNVTSRVKAKWVAADGQIFRKESKDEWQQSDRVEC